jgi:hypothetical protein
MPYTGVKGEFEVVGFTTLTYVLVLVGTYGAIVFFVVVEMKAAVMLTQWQYRFVTVLHGNLHAFSWISQQPSGMVTAVTACLAGYAFYIQVPTDCWRECALMRHVVASSNGLEQANAEQD